MTFLAHMALSERLCLSLKAPESDGTYPTSKIQKGPVLIRGSADLSGEGVGLACLWRNSYIVSFFREKRV